MFCKPSLIILNFSNDNIFSSFETSISCLNIIHFLVQYCFHNTHLYFLYLPFVCICCWKPCFMLCAVCYKSMNRISISRCTKVLTFVFISSGIGYRFLSICWASVSEMHKHHSDPTVVKGVKIFWLCINNYQFICILNFIDIYWCSLGACSLILSFLSLYIYFVFCFGF